MKIYIKKSKIKTKFGNLLNMSRANSSLQAQNEIEQDHNKVEMYLVKV